MGRLLRSSRGHAPQALEVLLWTRKSVLHVSQALELLTLSRIGHVGSCVTCLFAEQIMLTLLPEREIKYRGEFLFNKFCAKFLCAICSVFLRICAATH